MSAKTQARIKVVCRFRPMDGTENAAVSPFTQNSSTVYVPSKIQKHRYSIRKTRCTKYLRFDLDEVLGININADQEMTFESVAKPIVEDIIDGYNGTVFAYGQTGSGKTYSMIGVASDGIIPKSISMLFECLNANPNIIKVCALFDTFIL